MSATQIYEQTIRPLSTGEKLAIARLILDEVAPVAEASSAETGFASLKRLLPHIERVTVTDADLASVVLKP